jgi:hypothetical protein
MTKRKRPKHKRDSIPTVPWCDLCVTKKKYAGLAFVKVGKHTYPLRGTFLFSPRGGVVEMQVGDRTYILPELHVKDGAKK